MSGAAAGARQADPAHLRRLERMYVRAPVNGIHRPTIAVGEGVAQVTTRVDERFHHAGGAVHGSVLFKALDDAAFFAANSIAGTHCLVTFGFQLTLLAPVREGELVAEGRVTGETRGFVLADAELRDAAGALVARGSGTFARSRLAFAELPGYADGGGEGA